MWHVLPRASTRAPVLLTLMAALTVFGAAESAPAAVGVDDHPTARDRALRLVVHPPRVDAGSTARFAWTRKRGERTTCRLDAEPFARCGRSRTWRRLAPGRHVFTLRSARTGRRLRFRWTVRARARDARQLSISLTEKPPNPTTSPDATFAWTASTQVGSTSCTLDGLNAPCASPRAYRGLSAGPHSFIVTVSRRGATARASWSWSVSAPAPSPTPTPTPTAMPTPTPTPSGVALFQRTAVSYDSAVFDPPVEAPRNRLWIAQGFHYDLIGGFEAYNPSILSSVYKETIYTDARNSRPGSDPANPGGVSYFDADANHPDWFLKDSAGNRITYRNYSGYTLMDIGNPEYQARWALNVITQATRDGWDVVFADDLGLQLYSTSARPVKYPDAASWQAAVTSFVQGVYPKLHAAGVKLVTNTVSGVTYPTVRKELLQWVDGTMEEGWMRPSVDRTAPLATAAWPKQLAEAQDAEAAGKLFLAELPADSSDIQAVRYGLASLLLVANGMSSYGVSGNPSHTTEQWFPEFDTARRLGAPSDSFRKLANGVHRRDFANGAVLANPTTSTQTVSLGGSYSGSGFTGVSSVTMAPTSGSVLLRTG
jgi:hypothetical protein